ncbi:E3 ubiquitin-protein ligase Rnf220-like isoform X2 [Babylonia areolata]|uniref:E3 ubiquitin-protein ligase Rnf220-like isoform X2 n=1 Tax=Babylonia areolata TaxID=304850 RepID=UPI003FCF9921
MENSSFSQTPLSSSALMMLASSAEAREASQRAPPPHPFSAPPLDKEHTVPPPPFSTAGFVYRPDLLPSSLYAPIPPFPRPPLEQGIRLMGPSGGTFRHLGPHEGAEPYHSAFTPAKKKPEDASCSTTFATDSNHEQGFDHNVEGSKTDLPSPAVKEERPSSISSVGGDTNSEAHSDNGDMFDRGTPDSEGRTLRKSRKRALDGHLPCCPVCGLTLRPGETEAHVAAETEKLDRILKGGRKSRDSTPSGRKTLTSPPVKKGKDSPSPEVASKARYESYLRTRANRQSRLNARSRNKKRRGGEELVCPVCSERMTCTAEELTVHVDLCLKKKQGEEEEEEAMVDVEGEGEGEQYEEYTWAGQTRIRATTMLEGGFAGSGFQTSSSKRMSDDEGDLDVDGDDTEEYGEPQFTENDLIPLTSDEPMEDREQQVLLREALTSDTQRASGRAEKTCSAGDPTPGTSQSDPALDVSHSEGEGEATEGPGSVVSALKARLKELEGSRDGRHKCLICLNQYQDPLVSVQCWHVHCGQCWLQTLGAKKLCPQCNMITSTTNLRRIYL